MGGEIDVVVFVFLMAFVIDRTSRVLLSFVRAFGWLSAGSEREKAAYFVCSGVLIIPVLIYFDNMRVLHALEIYRGTAPTYEALDVIVTALLLLSGADFLGKLIELSGAHDADGGFSRSQTVEIGRQVHIRGTLEIVEDDDTRPRDSAAEYRQDEANSQFRRRTSV